MMLKIKHMAVTFVLILGGISMAGTAQASQMRPGYTPAPSVSIYAQPAQYAQNRQRKRANVSYAQAKSIALSRVPGEIQGINFDGREYRVRIIARNGKVVDVYVDAATGRAR